MGNLYLSYFLYDRYKCLLYVAYSKLQARFMIIVHGTLEMIIVSHSVYMHIKIFYYVIHMRDWGMYKQIKRTITFFQVINIYVEDIALRAVRKKNYRVAINSWKIMVKKSVSYSLFEYLKCLE